MAKKTVKKVDVKKVAKNSVSAQIKAHFEGLNMSVEDGQAFGFTEGTLVLHTDKCDIQIKLIAPKTGVDRYDKLVEDEVETDDETQALDKELEV